MLQRRQFRSAPDFPALALALAGCAWVSLALWDASPYGRYLHHGDWSALGLPSVLCSALPAGDWILPGALYAGGWVLMTAAMMLPTILSLIRLFDRMIDSRPQRASLHAVLLAGYLLVWTVFGILAHVLDRALHTASGEWTWLASHAWAPGAILLALAGLFQFSSIKYHCLDRCRTPLGFLTKYWHGRQPYREALRLGSAHGVYCVGCCWALMLLMFGVGTGSLGWMFALALLMAIEKNHSWGRHIAAPVGLVLLVSAAVVTGAGLTSPIQ